MRFSYSVSLILRNLRGTGTVSTLVAIASTGVLNRKKFFQAGPQRPEAFSVYFYIVVHSVFVTCSGCILFNSGRPSLSYRLFQGISVRMI